MSVILLTSFNHTKVKVKVIKSVNFVRCIFFLCIIKLTQVTIKTALVLHELQHVSVIAYIANHIQTRMNESLKWLLIFDIVLLWL